ncbi:fasciclin domain-containing protein [Mucilaginibacter celer]|uniref:FAS1 domain-containing protein n=1 Tax=Mucilaginibacter celer TaxID=2305508 RepID=A0A494VIA2_9SPHI|nr:fasciclin domain-containing protein [Mucilaginibacter celer]AYL93844.1 hypothetical protein HYN43_000385 [Mucilaginibacter celer]
MKFTMKKWKLQMICGLLACLAFGCKKQEFTLPPVGDKIPYEDEKLPALKEVIAQSHATLFYKAWQRSNMDAILKAQATPKTYFTVLLPGNAAMESAGYNEQKIQVAEPKELDSLLMFYTLRDRIRPEDLVGKTDNYNARTLLYRPDLQTTATNGPGYTYNYRIQLLVKDSKTYANGKIVGSGKSVAAKDGYIWLLDQPIVKPTKTILKFLDDDGRFTLLLQLLRYTDAQYNKIESDATGYPGSRKSFANWFGWDYIIPGPGSSIRQVVSTTLFLPTDAAFKAAGFSNLQDLMAFNTRRGLPHWGTTPTGGGTMVGAFATDTLLNYSVNWGKMINIPADSYYAKFASDVPVFYSNVMGSPILSNYVVAGALDLSNPQKPDGEYYMPLDFTADGTGNINLKVKGSEAEPAKIIQADMLTMMGPVNAIDHLLLPKGYKLK